MDISIPELADGDRLVVKNFEPDQWPERPLGMTFHVYVARTARFLLWNYSERYADSEYQGDVVHFEVVGTAGLQEAVNRVAGAYWQRRAARQELSTLSLR